ncbi:hypothetical protein D0Y65_009360 [Glycine soja]|uniref:Reverse transcriptase zinc-binding domain-containing protein n=1 Tax=Glycine soja TaxID=3848 RepID=A0A445KYM3_GLYSO|nr:hypothetical protein D0Y65_009360 [Glycine soja]
MLQRRLWLQWEIPIVQQLEEASEGWEPKVGGKDGWVWKNNAAKTFIVKEFKGLLWRVGHNRIQTKYNLRRMNLLQDGTSLNCVFCNLGMEFAKCYVWLGKIRVLHHMNHIIFNEVSLEAREVLDSIKYQAWSRCKAYVKEFKLSLYIWCIY